MQLDLTGKTAVVTGASRNIGRAVCLALSKAGATVWGCARNEGDLSSLKAEMDAYGAGHGVIVADLMAGGGIDVLQQTLTENAVSADIVVHNLGGSLQVRDPFATGREFSDVWKYNLGISVDLNAQFVPAMRRKGWGRIVHLSTSATQTFDGNLAYISAKCALNGYVKCMSRQLAPDGIVMCAVAPGLVELEGRYFTNLKSSNPAAMEEFYDDHLPIRRMVQPEEIGALIVSLCTPMADYMVGSIVALDGGHH